AAPARPVAVLCVDLRGSRHGTDNRGEHEEYGPGSHGTPPELPSPPPPAGAEETARAGSMPPQTTRRAPRACRGIIMSPATTSSQEQHGRSARDTTTIHDALCQHRPRR